MQSLNTLMENVAKVRTSLVNRMDEIKHLVSNSVNGCHEQITIMEKHRMVNSGSSDEGARRVSLSRGAKPWSPATTGACPSMFASSPVTTVFSWSPVTTVFSWSPGTTGANRAMFASSPATTGACAARLVSRAFGAECRSDDEAA